MFDAYDTLVELECLAADAAAATTADEERGDEEAATPPPPSCWWAGGGGWERLGGLVGLHASYLRLHHHTRTAGGDLLAHLLAPWAAGLLLDPGALRRQGEGGGEGDESGADAAARVTALARRHAELLPMYARR